MIAKSILAAAAVSLLAAPSPLAAQAAFMPAVIGATVGQMAAQGADVKCLLNKRSAPAGAVDEARSGAEAAIRAYLALAAAAPSADVSAVFTAGKKKSGVWHGRDGDRPLQAVEDPIARAAAEASVSAPSGFVRAGDGRSALALWRVEKDGVLLGQYRATLLYRAKAWKLARLDVVEAPAEPDPIAYYCNYPGDSEAYAEALAKREAKRAARRAARQAQREAQAGGRSGG